VGRIEDRWARGGGISDFELRISEGGERGAHLGVRNIDGINGMSRFPGRCPELTYLAHSELVVDVGLVVGAAGNVSLGWRR